jgi:hypothetical protein
MTDRLTRSLAALENLQRQAERRRQDAADRSIFNAIMQDGHVYAGPPTPTHLAMTPGFSPGPPVRSVGDDMDGSTPCISSKPPVDCEARLTHSKRKIGPLCSYTT